MEPIIYKKYNNRKVYSSEKKSYTGHEDIYSKLVSGTKFKVVEAGSGNDITLASAISSIYLKSKELSNEDLKNVVNKLFNLLGGTNE